MPAKYDVPRFAPPAVDARVDVTDLYAFQHPRDPAKSVVITNVNPLAPTHADHFRPGAVYEMLVDTDDDARPDIALRCRFGPRSGDRQVARVTRAILTVELEDGHIHEELETQTLVEDAPASFGAEPLVTEGADGVRFFAGLRSDPLFFDLLRYVDGMDFRRPGTDFFADKNVLSIAIELPNHLLGDNTRVGLWARTLVPMAGQRDHFTQFDQVGGPLTGLFFNNSIDQATFARTEPSTQGRTIITTGETFLDSFAGRLHRTGGYPNDQAHALARTLLPDVLTFDTTDPRGFPNGRRLDDDVVDAMLTLLTNGAVTTDHVAPHADYLTGFPYVGSPHPDATARPAEVS